MRSYRIYLFTVPAVFVLGAFFVYPILLSGRLSFTDFTGVGVANDVGWKHFERIFTRSRYVDALKVTLLFTLVVVTVQTAAGLFFAAILHRLPAVRNFCRAALFLPAMMSFVIVGYVWQFIYSPFDGALNSLLGALGLGFLAHNWIGDPSTALYALAFTHVWMFVGYTTAIFLAGYAAIPREYDEAARLEGTTGWQRFRHIEVPLLAPSFTINVVLSTIGTLKTFELPFIMTRGGPDGATRTLSLHIIDSLFGKYQFGFASALSIVMLILVVLVAWAQNRVLRARETRLRS